LRTPLKRELPTPSPFNPLEKVHLAESVARVLLEQSVESLPPDEFRGAGLYAIYYAGDFPDYAPLSARNLDGAWEIPIYVGRAQPKGARKGIVGLDTDPGTELRSRLRQHAQSIEAASNLNVDDFCCRYLVVEDIWIALGEALLIKWFSPLWNRVLDGFGNHAPGKGREAGACPLWDTLHPGRDWACKLPPSPVALDEIRSRVSKHLKEFKPDFETGRIEELPADLLAAED
jgi:hypothetical protein